MLRSLLIFLAFAGFAGIATSATGQENSNASRKIPSGQPDTEHKVGPDGLTVEGKLTPDDAKVTVLLDAKKSETLTAKRFLVKLDGGKRYEISMTGRLMDSVLIVQDATGKQLAWDDDDGGGLDSSLEFQAPADGVYQIHTAMLRGGGAFTLRIRRMPGASPLSADRRKALLAKRKELTDATVTAFGKRQIPLGRKAALAAMEVAKELYPADDYPNGHRVLALTFHDAGLLLHFEGRLSESEPFFREAVAVYKRFFMGEDHSDSAMAMTNLGSLLLADGKLSDAEIPFRGALAMRKRLFKSDNPDVAQSYNNLAELLRAQGKLLEAEPFYRDALTIYKAFFKGNHPYLAVSLNNLAILLKEQGKWTEAEGLFREAIDMQRSSLKGNDPNLAVSLSNLALLLQGQGKLLEAEKTCREALAMIERSAMGDHPLLASSMNTLAGILHGQGNLAEAEPLLRRALDMRRRLFMGDHPNLAMSQNNLAGLLHALGKVAEAEDLCRNALAMDKRLFSGDHPNLATTLTGLGAVLAGQHKFTEAEPYLRDGLHMSRRLAVLFAEAKSEGEALTFLGASPFNHDGFLSATRHRNGELSDVYNDIWSSKAVLGPVHARRRQAARALTADPKTAALLSELADARHRRAELILAPFVPDPATKQKRAADLKVYSKRVEQIEAELRPLLPAITRAEKLARAGLTDLQAALPPGTAVVDFLAYNFFEFNKEKSTSAGQKHTPSYVAFIVTREKIKRVELGSAPPIEKAVREWRQAIVASKVVPSDMPIRVRELVWEKVRKQLPMGIKTVFIAPDMALTAVPWAALPGDQIGTILLEDYALAVIPNVPFLLEQLWPDNDVPKRHSALLVLGDVDFNAAVPPMPLLDIAASRGVTIKPARKSEWAALPGTQLEAKGIFALAIEQKREARLLHGKDATAHALMTELPKARFAHLATHGFFADKTFRSAFQYDPKLFEMQGTERVGAAVLSPMVLSGLVLAGANRPDAPGRGLVTGESLIDRDLSGLELAMLSACETGLGDVAGGEGVFGLQRAFHLAGTRNVVASLWKVDDIATAALMALFYRELWDMKQPPIEALRRAQLEIYRNPKKVPDWAKSLARTFEEVKGSAAVQRLPDAKGRAHPYHWAAFTLSGTGILRNDQQGADLSK